MSDWRYGDNDIAIVGLAGRFPGAPDIGSFWRNLCAGMESIRRYGDDELAALGVPEQLRRHRDFVPAAATVDGADLFDNGFWGYSPREAALLDPQQRLFLETAWEALEHAGYDPLGYPGLIGVYAGTGLSTYLLFNLLGSGQVAEHDTSTVMLGNDKDFLSTRVAYHLNLRGPSVAVQSGCSTSLVAAHLAADALLSYQCDIALAGGVTIAVPQRTGYLYVPGGTASPDGHCRAFDADGAGTLFGSGAGVVVLKRIGDALADRDTIYAVIKGSAVNNDGAHKVGFTAPSVEGQAEVIVRAQHVAQVPAATVGYVEAHGTATGLGDPMEVAALTRAFRDSTDRRAFCALGSVKTNIGHLDTAAGVASLIKTALTLYHKEIPASLNFSRPNPQIDFAATPFYVNTELAAWPAGPDPRRAGVSAFGFGGTNAHLVLEEAGPPTATGGGDGPALIVLSAKTAGALDAMSRRLAEHLGQRLELSLADVAYTSQVGRARFDHRRALVCHDRDDAVRLLSAPDSPGVRTRHEPRQGRPVAFMFPGLGDQYPGMGRDLYRHATTFRETVDRCAELLRPHLGLDLRDVLYPEPDAGEAPASGAGTLDLRAMLRGAGRDSPLDRTEVAHPALFVVEYALARQWMAWGMKPSALIGHSLGEYVAAAVAGVFALEDGLMLVAHRARLIAALPPGAMLAVPLPAEEVADLAGDRLFVALVNGDRLTVVAGEPAEVEALQRRLIGAGTACRRLRAGHAFHSRMMDPVVGPLADRFRTVTLAPPQVPYVSNVTGTWVRPEDATDPTYWAQHTAQAVRFAPGLRQLRADPEQVLLELGPGQSLSALAAEQHAAAGATGEPLALPSLRLPYDHRLGDTAFLLDVLGQLWLRGVTVDWPAVHAPARPGRVPLPTYPFERQRCWIDPPGTAAASPGRSAAGRRPPDEWLHAAGWRSVPLPPPRLAGTEPGGHWLLLADPVGVTAALAERLSGEAATVTVVEPGTAFARTATGGYRLDPADPAGYLALAEALRRDGREPDKVVHAWSLAVPAAAEQPAERALALGFHSLVYLARALARGPADTPVGLWIVSDGVVAVDRADPLRPEKATLLGPARCIPQEYERIDVHYVDLAIAARGGAGYLADQLLDLIAESPTERVLAYRDGRRWIETFEPLARSGVRHTAHPIRERGGYLLVGGLGRVGLDLAEHLAAQVGARLALVGRSSFPAEDEWPAWLAAHGDQDPTSARIRRLRALRERGTQVLVLGADVADPDQMGAAVARAREHLGGIDGVFHVAGVAGLPAFALLDDLTSEQAQAQFHAKLQGCPALAEALRGIRPDFVALISSNAAILGGLGLAAYAAGNLYLDAYAQHRSDRYGERWISINLEDWLSAGDPRAGDFQTSLTPYSVGPEDGARAVQRAVETATVPHVTLVTGDLEARLDRWIRQPATARHAGTARPGHRHPRPAVDTAYAAPEGSDECTVAEIWQELLGIAQIGRHDNFYELGGHSLLATQIVSRLRTAFRVDLSLLTLFGAPTVAGLAERIRGCRPVDGQQAPVPRVPRGEPLPLSYAQRTFWFLDQLAPGNPFYNVADLVRIDGPLRLDVLRRSLNDVVARHESLRTGFVPVDGEPVQVVADTLNLPLPCLDLTDLPAAERGPRVERLATDEAQAPFDLAHGPLIRTTVLKLADDEHVLLLVMHHSVSDAWSTGVLIRELSVLYVPHAPGGAEADGGTAAGALPPLPVQYADYAVWQRERLRGPALEALLDFWRTQLHGAPELLELPTDHPRPTVQTFHGAGHPLQLPARLVARLRELGNTEGCTLFMTLLAGFACLLHRYTGESDLVVGSPIAGRTRPEFEDLIGAFVNMLPLRTRVHPQDSFRAVLARVRETTLAAYAHQELPFEMLVEAVAPRRDLGYSPVFQVVLVLQNAPLPALALADLRMEQVAMPVTTAKFDLMVMLRETGEDVTGVVEYATDLFAPDTVARLAAHYTTLLERIVDGPDRRVGELELMPAAERDRLLRDWALGEGAAWPWTTIPELVATQAAARPDAVAVRAADPAGGHGLTFGEVAARANQVARYLHGLGVGRDARVGVCLDRSPETVVLLLGIITAGAAYVPLDPGYPAARLALMSTDAALDLLITADGHDDRPVSGSGRSLTTRELWGGCAGLPATAPTVPAGPQDALYCIYTSGSTGRPKGVVGLAGGMLNRLRWMWQRFPFEPGEVLCQKTSLSFLDSCWEIFGPLCQGVPVVVVPDQVVLDPPALVATLARHEVSRLVLVPSLLRALLDTCPDLADRLPRLRLWVTSGEALPVDLAQRFAAALPGRSLLNLYGSSEVSADVTYHLVGPEDLARETVPIGRPVAHTSVHVLDAQLNPVPAGVPGDLYVGGAALARGYLHRPGLTAQRFVPDPLAATPGARLYRTGDQARFRPDGVLEYLGRRDQQVKVRGFRIELAEVEGSLTAEPTVASAVAAVHGDTLVSYVVPRAGAAVDATALRAFLSARLPDYMVPTRFVALPELPLTPSGKVDRRALAEVGHRQRPDRPATVPPRTATEEVVAGMWEAALERDGVGSHDNFFTVGGHSLLATRLVAQLREAFDVDLPLQVFFQDATVAGVAAALLGDPDRRAAVERRAALLVSLADLSDDEVDGMLAEPDAVRAAAMPREST